jgi:hypothetical protein
LLALVLARNILELVRCSGANRTEALSAVEAAKALIPSLGLEPAVTLKF